MQRRILIAEQTDTLRTVAETVLRQNGYDVIAVTAAEKAREVLELSKPRLVIVGADLTAPDGVPYYQKLRQDSKLSAIPMLLFEPVSPTDLEVPDEMVIPRPFDPEELLQRVAQCLGQQETTPPGTADPSNKAQVDDDFLDAALGLDQLDVTGSEVMDKTVMGRQAESAAKEKLIGLESSGEPEDTDTGVSAVESMVLEENSNRAKPRTVGRKAPPQEGTGKLEILSDQFGLTKAPTAGEDDNAAHDYDWFVDAVKKDNDPAAKRSAPNPEDSARLTISEPSAAVDPVTPGPAPSALGQAEPSGVDKFIDEFRKEMEELRESEAHDLVASATVTAAEASGLSMAWEEKLEKLGPSQIDLFAREFARELGRKVAEIIVAKIDPEKLLRLLKAEIVAKYKNSD